MKSKLYKAIALVVVLLLIGNTFALAVNVQEEENDADELSAEKYAAIYNEAKYENDFETGEVVVELKADVTAADYADLFPELDIVSIDVSGLTRTRLLLTLFDNSRESVIEAIDALKDSEYVYCAYPNYLIQVDEVETAPPISAVAANNINTNSANTISTAQWNHQMIHLNEAWQVTTGSDSVSVGIIDTGISPDYRLAGNLDASLSRCFVHDGNCPVDNCALYDAYGHGTMVASVVGAADEAGGDMCGICQNVKIVSLKALDGTISNERINILNIAHAVEYAAENDIDILNISLYVIDYSKELESAINAFDGVIFIAAGNNGLYLNNWSQYP